jgi:MoaA/NifB/PqqE/SkfB family radical SAM enzyme
MDGNAQEIAYPGVREGRLSIEVTTRCNIACPHCFARAGTAKPTSLSVELVKTIVREGYDTGYRGLHLTGGEPLLWEGLFEVLDCAFGMGYRKIFMNTNGTLLKNGRVNRLASYGDLSISVSLEGSEALHDRLRGEGLFRKTLQSIERAHHAGISLFIFTLATKSLLPDLPHFANDLYNRFPGIHCLILIPIAGTLNGHHTLSQESLPPEDFLRMVRTVSLLNVYGLRTIFLHDSLVNVASKMLKMPWIPHTEPLYREGNLVVMANRNIGVVHSKRDSFGRYRAGMIQKVLTSEAYRRAVGPDDMVCPSCKYFELCRENGMDQPSDYEGDMRFDLPYCMKVLDRAVS